MKTLALAFLFSLGLGASGCLVQQGGSDPMPTDDAGVAGGGGDMKQQHASTDMASSASVADLANVDMIGSTLKPFGADCTTGAECATGICDQFQMGAIHKCTQLCTMGCPAPPSLGTCNGKGECKF